MSMRRNYKFRPPLDKRFSTSNSNEMKKRKSNLEDLEERIFFLVEISLRWTCFRAVGHAPNWNGLEAVEAKRKTHQEIIQVKVPFKEGSLGYKLKNILGILLISRDAFVPNLIRVYNFIVVFCLLKLRSIEMEM